MTAKHDASLWESSLLEFRNRVAADSPTPGGGAVAAVAATLAAALLRMVCAIVKRRKPDAEINAVVAQITLCEEKVAHCADEDVRVFDRYMAARKVQGAHAKSNIQQCLLACAEVPLAAAEQVAKLQAYAAEIALQAPEFLASDIVTAQSLLYSSRRGLVANVTINLADLDESEEKRRLLQRLDPLMRDANVVS
jgi:glutamate formiminotransferase/formiminotetrahydrofolate cyclodeaminase